MDATIQPILWGELDPLLSELQAIIRDTSIQSIEIDREFNTPGSEHISQVMARLSEEPEA